MKEWWSENRGYVLIGVGLMLHPALLIYRAIAHAKGWH